MVRNIIGNYIAVSITFLKNFFPPAFEIEKERDVRWGSATVVPRPGRPWVTSSDQNTATSPFWIHKNTKISWSHTNFSELRCASWPMVPVSNLKDFSGLSTHEIAEFAVTSGCATAGRAGWPKPPVWWQIPALSG